jgi:peptide deformylase
MLETMYAAPGIGLAAVQVGEMNRLITIDVSHDEDAREPRVFVNPEILWKSEEMSVYEEGCLSIPEFYEEVERPARVRVRYTNLAGEPEEIEADGLLATCLQHEIDHLDGVLFIDHISRLKRERVTKRFIKAAKEKARI